MRSAARSSSVKFPEPLRESASRSFFGLGVAPEPAGDVLVLGVRVLSGVAVLLDFGDGLRGCLFEGVVGLRTRGGDLPNSGLLRLGGEGGGEPTEEEVLLPRCLGVALLALARSFFRAICSISERPVEPLRALAFQSKESQRCAF